MKQNARRHATYANVDVCTVAVTYHGARASQILAGIGPGPACREALDASRERRAT